jgi:hypothetical protein
VTPVKAPVEAVWPQVRPTSPTLTAAINVSQAKTREGRQWLEKFEENTSAAFRSVRRTPLDFNNPRCKLFWDSRYTTDF